jgi:tRNA(Arg) A34 adenosine deaminase TadA
MKGLQLAYREAMRSSGVGGPKRTAYRIGACLMRGDEVLEVRHNSYKTHPYLAKLTQYPHLHAESHCMLAHGIDRCHGTTMYVVRVLRDGSVANAKPCEVCYGIMLDLGVRLCYYTENRDRIGIMRFQPIPTGMRRDTQMSFFSTKEGR